MIFMCYLTKSQSEGSKLGNIGHDVAIPLSKSVISSFKWSFELMIRNLVRNDVQRMCSELEQSTKLTMEESVV
jgi:hypothetical protein